MVTITQTGHATHEAVGTDGTVLSTHARQDQAIEAVIVAGGGQVRTVQTLRIHVSGGSRLGLPFTLT